MEGFSVQLPLTIDPIDGPYALNKSVVQVAKQNLKMLVLTSPGERIMLPIYGVGIRQYIFQNIDNFVFNDIRQRIEDQVELFLPYIRIDDIAINQNDTNTHKDLYTISIKIFYTIKSIAVKDSLQVNLE